MSPRVSVIIATYNWSSVLPYSIGSVLRQTMPDFEVLVVGDGCTDDSEHVVAGIHDPRVRWINLPANTRHQSGPNNEGLRQARGEIIAYLGHDDLWLPHHLAVMVSALDSTGADLAYSLCTNVGPDETSGWPSIPRPQSGSFASPLCIVHRKRMIEEIGGWQSYRELHDAPDVELLRRARDAGYRFTFVPRLTGIKFPAGWRRGVYESRPCHEQANWLARIESEPDFEVHQLVSFVVGGRAPTGLPYREILRHVVSETLSRLRKRWSLQSWFGLHRRRSVDDVRHFKGLTESARRK
jgi:glycosyltransferase involved in cell wall biosynthesis